MLMRRDRKKMRSAGWAEMSSRWKGGEPGTGGCTLVKVASLLSGLGGAEQADGQRLGLCSSGQSHRTSLRLG